MRIHTAIVILLWLLPSCVQSQTTKDQGAIKILRNGSQPSRQGPAENFTGSVRIEPLIQPNAPSHTSGSLVMFEAGARTAWHTHPLGQILIVTAGTGRVQRFGDPVEEIRQGDVVWIPGGQKHWHGAAPNSSMAHVGIVEQLDGKSVDWMEKVSDSQYNAPIHSQELRNEGTAKTKPSQAAIGDFAPKLAELTDDVLYGDVWERPELSKRGPKLGDCGCADRVEPPRAASISPHQGAGKRCDAGRVDRNDHPSGVLLRLAECSERNQCCQGSFREEIGPPEQKSQERQSERSLDR